MKRIISLLLMLCIILSSGIVAYSDNTGVPNGNTDNTLSAENKIICENEKYMLIFDKESYLLQIKDKHNGFIWSSNFVDNSNDNVVMGIVKTDMLSNIVVSYAFGSDIKTTNSRVGSILKNAASVKAIENGVRVDYGFGDYGFNIPVEYVLEEDGLKASVILKDIKEEKDNKIISVELLPFFSAEATKTNDGYLFVPDGSGAVISFEERESGIKETYEKMVYGEDLLTPSDVQTTYDKDIKIPVYGMKTGDNGFVAIIEKGAENSAIYASAAGQKADCFIVGSKYIYRANDYVEVTMQNGSKSSSLFYSEPDSDIDKYTVKYTLLSGDKADYVGMAEVYRSYLLKNGLKESSNDKAKLYLDLYGGLNVQASFLGIPYKTVNVLTDFKQAQKILDSFKEKGVENISLGLKSYTDSAVKGKTEINLKPLSKLGGKKGLKNLLTYSEENNVTVYPNADFFSFSKKGNGIGSNKTKVYSLEKSPLRLKGFTLADNYRVDNERAISFVRPSKYEYSASKLIKSASKLKLKNIGLGEISAKLISDYSSSYVSRREAKELLLSALDKVEEKLAVSSYNANDYLWKYSEMLADIPTCSSKYNVFSYDIPFLQIVLKGVKNYSTESLNLSGMTAESFLRSIESGSYLKFEGIYAENSKIKGTQLGDIFGANYKAWFETAVKWYSETEKLYKAVGNSKITEHSVNGDTAVTVYENGTRVYVNYSEKQVDIDGVTVEPLWYLIKEGN